MSGRVNRIVKRIYYAAEISLRSPLALSCGESETTDMDVLRNSRGEVFIPGTSIAGAFRNYLQRSRDKEGSFGFSKGEDGRMSSVYISDIYLQAPKITVRDGVQLSDEKQVENKFDMEIIEPGAAGILYLTYVIRENDLELDVEQEAAHLIRAVESGEIRFGRSKNRGFGRAAVRDIYQAEFTAAEVKEWISFSTRYRELSAYPIKKKYEEWIRICQESEQKYYRINVPLKLTGGISIREYSAEPSKADFEHITSNGEPVIPGTSWNGAIRADVKDILQQLGCSTETALDLMKLWFGYVNVAEGQKNTKKDREPDALQSLVVVGESVIRGESVRVPMTRNKISRFDASTIEGALYSEIVNCGGVTELELLVRKDEERQYRALLAVLELVIQDICKGYVSVGGQAAVGRGIFCLDEGSVDGGTAGLPKKILDDDTRKKGQEELIDLIEERRCIR